MRFKQFQINKANMKYSKCFCFKRFCYTEEHLKNDKKYYFV